MGGESLRIIWAFVLLTIITQSALWYKTFPFVLLIIYTINFQSQTEIGGIGWMFIVSVYSLAFYIVFLLFYIYYIKYMLCIIPCAIWSKQDDDEVKLSANNKKYIKWRYIYIYFNYNSRRYIYYEFIF